MGAHNERGFITEVVTSVTTGVIAAGVTALLAFVFREPISAYVAEQNPTCDAPTGLVQVQSTDLSVVGQGDTVDHQPENAVDGYLGSLWVPPRRPESLQAHQALFFEDEAQNTIHVTLPEPTEIALICVNNGVANNREAYENWGRVRTVAVWRDRSTDADVTTLASLPPDAMQTAQQVAEDLGTTDHFTMQVKDAYAGSTIQGFDPDWCGGESERVSRPGGETVQLRDERGCLLAPSPRAGISELTIFTPAD